MMLPVAATGAIAARLSRRFSVSELTPWSCRVSTCSSRLPIGDVSPDYHLRKGAAIIARNDIADATALGDSERQKAIV